jgi:hypothetical protein
MAVAAGAAAVTGAVLDTRAIAAQYEAERQAGFFAFEARSGSTDGLDARRCWQFAAVEGVAGAGAVLGEREVTPLSAPNQVIRVVEATPGTADALWPDRIEGARGSVVAGPWVAERFGLEPGRAIAITDGLDLQVDGVATNDSSVGGFDSAVLIATVPEVGVRSDSCLVRAEPGSRTGVKQALAGWFDPADKVVVFNGFERGAGAIDPAQRLKTRASSPLALSLGALVCLAITLSWWVRRREVSLYRMLGARRSDILAMVGVEVALIWVAPAAVGAGAAVVVLSPDSIQAAAALLDLIRLWAFIGLAPLVAFVSLWRVKPWDGVRGM